MPPAHDRLDNLIHAPKRLELLAILAGADQVSFATLCEELELRDSDLSRQLRLLEEAGLVKIRKLLRNPQHGTWVSITEHGRERFQAHVIVLRSLAAKGGE